MNVNALKFFNNKGNQLNFQYTDGIWNGKMLYDNNGSDTYKVQSIYMMEETDELSDSNVGIEKFQYFPTGYNQIRSKTSNNIANVSDIKKVNSNSSFYTKWVYVDLDIKSNYKIGDRIFFEGGSGDFIKGIGALSTFTILALRSNSILIESDTANDTFTDLTSLTGVTIQTINCLELEDTAEIWNESDFNTKLKAGQPIILNNTPDNDGINYIDLLSESRYVFESYLNPTYTALPNDIVRVTVNLFSDRILLYDGSMTINAVNNTILFNNGIPNSFVVGYELAIQENIASVNSNNLQFLTITAIYKNTNTITVSASGSLFTQTVSAFLYLATNKIILEQPVLKLPDGNYDIYHTLTVLGLNLDSKILPYNLTTANSNNLLYVTQTLPTKNEYFSIVGEVFNNGNLIYTIPVSSTNKDIFIVNTTETLIEGSFTDKKNALNYFEVKITDIDSYGFDILLNGEVYHVNKHTNVTTTINTWSNDYLTLFNSRGINVYAYSDGIYFETMYPNVPMNIDVKFGQLAEYMIYHSVYDFPVFSNLTINIDGIDYMTPFDTDTSTTLQAWINTYQYKLLELGIKVSYSGSFLLFGTLSSKLYPVIKINAGYDLNNYLNTYFYLPLRGKNINTTLTSNKIINANTGINFENRKYYSGQTLIISGISQIISNGAYNIISVDPTEMVISYQGPIWSAPSDITINAGKGLRKPTRGLQSDPAGRLRCTWEDTIKDEIFFFDFSGSQLIGSPALQPIMSYTGVMPLCGPNNEYEVILNKEPNLDSTKKSLPYYQQTVFNELFFELGGYDEPVNNLEYPEAIQIHTGYNSTDEGVHNSTMSIYFEEDITNTIDTDINLGDDIVQFIASDNSINLVSSTLSFVNMGYKPDQIIKFKSTDNTGDSKYRLVSVNAGKEFKIVSVTATKMVLSGDTIKDELSIQELPVISQPFYTNGVMNVANRSMSIEITVQPKLIMKVQMWGQTESEDERHKINLNRLGRNIYGSDLDILQDYDSDEKGIDWVLLNNKRKQLLISGNEIFDYIGSYKSIKNAINYWEWTSLNLQEYFINVNTKSPDYGKLHTIDVIGLFDGTKPDHTKSKLPVRLPNANYKKTNKFSLIYSITDDDGTIISGLTVNEVYAKLYKLKNWLVEKVVPVGTHLRDVSFKLKSKDVNTNVVSTISSQWLNSTSTHDAIQFDVTGYTIPVNASAGSYSISITPKSINTNFHYEIKVKTFGLELYNSTRTYNIGEYVFNNGKVWIADRASIGIEPSAVRNTGQWILATSWTMPIVQVYQEQRFDSLPVIFTINKNLDPNFEVTITSYGDYGLSWVETKNYTLNYGPWL